MATDFSGCVEMSAGYYGFNYFQSGHVGIAFDCTGNASERIYGKDPTSATDITKATFYLERVYLGCGSASAALYDGSAGYKITGKIHIDKSAQADNINLDFGKDPLRVLVAENTQSLCISAADGLVSGFIKGYWGV